MSHETVVIGGGPAGSAAAIQLAKLGVPVRLLERKSEPHHKVCGEFISNEAAQYLENLGLNLPALGAVPIHRVRFYNGEQELPFALPFTAWSLSRQLLDAALLERASSVGVSVEVGRVVRQLSRVGDLWEMSTRCRSSPGNATPVDARRELSAKTVFLASGKHELRDWRRDVKGDLKADDNFIGLKMHFRPDALQHTHWQNAVEIHLFNGGYAGLEPIEEGRVNLCFLIRQSVYKACGASWPSVLDWLGRTSSHLRQRLAHLTPLWDEPLAVSGIPYGYVHSPRDAVSGLFRLGDQAAVIPSFAGDGIAIALHTASLAARVHAAGGDSRIYQQQAYKNVLRPVRDAKFLADVMSYRVGRNLAFRCALLWPALSKEMILRTRVGLVEAQRS